MSQQPGFDASIPVLTEVFQDQPAGRDAKAAEPVEPDPLAEFVTDDDADADAVLETRAIDNWTEPEWNVLERRLSERILQQLQGRVDFVLEQRLRDAMEEALTSAIAGLTGEIRAGLQQTIEKIVVRAVAQELAHLQTLKK